MSLICSVTNRPKRFKGVLSFFKREGYLIKKGVLDPELMTRARERKWVGAPDRMKPDDPTTWIGSWRADEETSEADEDCKIGYTWKYREPAHEEWLAASTTNPSDDSPTWILGTMGSGSMEHRGALFFPNWLRLERDFPQLIYPQALQVPAYFR